MQKLLKVSGVSILAIVATTGANAAGYTCEELIEYTSCNSGYALSVGSCVQSIACDAGLYSAPACPDGYDYSKYWCKSGESSGYDNTSEESCIESGYEWIGAGCYQFEPAEGPEYTFVPFHYACESCPDTDLVSPDGTPIRATSVSGATSIAECHVPSGVEIQGEHGTYRFKSQCGYFSSVNWKTPVTNEKECVALAEATGDNWEWFDSYEFSGYSGEVCIIDSGDISDETIESYMPKTESECAQIDSNSEWNGTKCVANYAEGYYFNSDGLHWGMW